MNKTEVILKLNREPIIAHQTLFAERHPYATPRFHDEIIRAWHGHSPKLVIMTFRMGGKSTLAEEAIILDAALRRVKNAIILGSSFERACERLRAIKHQIETNELLMELFGDLKGETWNEGKVILKRWLSQ